MSGTLRRCMFAAGGASAALLAVATFANALGLMADPQPAYIVLIGIPAAGMARLLLTRAFGAEQFRGLRLVAERIGLTLDVRTGEVVGRLRGIPVRAYPATLSRQVAVEVENPLGERLVRENLGDPWDERSGRKIADAIGDLVWRAERAQRDLVEEAKTGSEGERVAAVRRLAAIGVEARIAGVDEVLATAAIDVSVRVRLAAAIPGGREAIAKTFGVQDEPQLLDLLRTGDDPTRAEAVAALALVGTYDSLPLLREHGRTPGAAEAIEAIRSRTGAEPGRISIAPPQGGEVSLARPAGALSKTKPD